MHSDTHERVVSLSNLKAMCERISGVCHRYAVEHVSAHRVRVAYTGPRFDEVGYQEADHTIVAYFPCYKRKGLDEPEVVLEFLDVQHDDMAGEGWQCFEGLRECPVLWCNSVNGEDAWESRREVWRRFGMDPQGYTGHRYVEKHPDGSVRDCFPEREG